MDTTLDILTPKLSKLTKLDLSPTYSHIPEYTIEVKSYLHKHSDRYSCDNIDNIKSYQLDIYPIYLIDTKGQR